MTQAAVRASLVLFAALFAVPVGAQSKQDVITGVVLDAADAYDRARAQKQARREEQARQELARLQDQQRADEVRRKADEQRRKDEVAAIRRWPGQGALTPPLEPGEVYTETQNGCGVIIGGDERATISVAQLGDDGKPVLGADGKPVMEQVAPRAYMRTVVWSGDCPNGLAHGLGALARRSDLLMTIDYQQEYAYGRMLSRMFMPDVSLRASNVTYRASGRQSATIPAWRDPFKPRFGNSYAGNRVSTALRFFDFSAGTHSIAVEAMIVSCIGLAKKPRGCSYDDNFDAFVIRTIETGDGPPRIADTVCPDPRSEQGCEAVWQQVAGPVIAKIEPLVAEANANDQARRTRLARLNSGFLLTARVQQMARAAEEQQAVERRKAAARTAELEARKERDAAAAAERAAQEKTERAFKAKLATLNAGQLYVMADELKVAGKSAQARDALRAFITRFPDHALAASAASALATLK